MATWTTEEDGQVIEWESEVVSEFGLEWGYMTARPLLWRQVRDGMRSAMFYKPVRPRSRRR